MAAVSRQRGGQIRLLLPAADENGA